MSPEFGSRSPSDHVSLAWIAAWCVLLTLIAVAIASTSPAGQLDDGTQMVLGCTLGGLSAAWTLIGTWLLLMDLPDQPDDSSDGEIQRQNVRLRLVPLVFLVANAAVLFMGIHGEPDLIAQVSLTVLIGMMLPALAAQWTRQRIRRGTPARPTRRSIRQMLGIATSVAILIATIQWSGRLLNLPLPIATAIAANVSIWLIMLVLMLGRWSAMVLLAVPLAGGIWLAATVFAETQSQNLDLKPLVVDGMIVGFSFMALIFLMMLRSSGHRWIANWVSS